MDEIDIDKKIAAIRLKNSTINSRHEEIERDKRIAEEQGAAIIREQNCYVRPEISEDYNFVGEEREDENELKRKESQPQVWRYKSPRSSRQDRSDFSNKLKPAQEDCRQIIERRRAEAERLRRTNKTLGNCDREWNHDMQERDPSVLTLPSRPRTVITTATVMPPEFVDAAVEELRMQLQTAQRLDTDPLQFAAEAALTAATTLVDKWHKPVQRHYDDFTNGNHGQSHHRRRGETQNNKFDASRRDEKPKMSQSNEMVRGLNRMHDVNVRGSNSLSQHNVEGKGSNVSDSKNGMQRLHNNMHQQLKSGFQRNSRGRGRLSKEREKEKKNYNQNDDVDVASPIPKDCSNSDVQPASSVISNVLSEVEPADKEFLRGHLEFSNKHRRGGHQKVSSRKSESSTGSEYISSDPVTYDFRGEYIDDELADIEQLLLKVEDHNFTLLDVDIDEPISSWAREVSLEEARQAAEARLTAVSLLPKEQQSSRFTTDIILQQLRSDSSSFKKSQN